VLLVFAAARQLRLPEGREHGRTIPLAEVGRLLTIHAFAKIFNCNSGCLGVGCKKHVRSIQPSQFAIGPCRDDFVHVLSAYQAICAPMQAKQRAFDLAQSAALVYAKHI
jgi:hypothetical protein